MYEYSIHCYTKAEYRQVLPPSKHLARPRQRRNLGTGRYHPNWRCGSGGHGAGIAEVFAEAGYEVLWYNRSEAGMQRGMARRRANQATLIRHGVRTQEAADMAWMRLPPTHTLQDLARDTTTGKDTPGV